MSQKRIARYVSTQPLGIVALILVLLSGGSAYAAVQVANNSVKSKHIRNGAVKAPDLGKRSVTTKKLANGSVTVTKLGNGAVTVTKIGDGQVTGAKIADGSVSGAKIADGQVSGPDIADGAIGASKLDAVTVGDVKSAAGTLTSGAPAMDVLAVEGFGVLRLNCTAPSSMGFFYALNSPVPQRARVFGHDAIDDSPVGGASITNTAGGVGYNASPHDLLDGQVWTSTPDRVLWIEISIDPACAYRVRATVDRNDAP